MDKLPIAHIDTHVGRGVAVVGEEHQIARLQVAAAHGGAVVQLRRSAVGQGDAQLTVHIHGKAGAVEAAGGRAAVHIGHAQILIGDADSGAAGAAGRYAAGIVSRAVVGTVVISCGIVRGGIRGQRIAHRHILLCHIAGGVVAGHGVPAIALGQYRDSGALGQGGQNRAGRAALTAQPHIRSVDDAAAQRLAGGFQRRQLGGLSLGGGLRFGLGFCLRLGLLLGGLALGGGDGGLHSVRRGRRHGGAQRRTGGQSRTLRTLQLGGGGGQGDGGAHGDGVGHRHHGILESSGEDGGAGEGRHRQYSGQCRDQNPLHRLTAFRTAPAPARCCPHPWRRRDCPSRTSLPRDHGSAGRGR